MLVCLYLCVLPVHCTFRKSGVKSSSISTCSYLTILKYKLCVHSTFVTAFLIHPNNMLYPLSKLPTFTHQHKCHFCWIVWRASVIRQKIGVPLWDHGFVTMWNLQAIQPWGLHQVQTLDIRMCMKCLWNSWFSTWQFTFCHSWTIWCTNWGPAHLLLPRVGHCMAFGSSLHGSTRLCLWHSFEPPANQEDVALGHDMLCGFPVLTQQGPFQRKAPGCSLIWGYNHILGSLYTGSSCDHSFIQISIVQLSWRWIPSIELCCWWSWWYWKQWDSSTNELFWSEMPYCFPGLIFMHSSHASFPSEQSHQPTVCIPIKERVKLQILRHHDMANNSV